MASGSKLYLKLIEFTSIRVYEKRMRCVGRDCEVAAAAQTEVALYIGGLPPDSPILPFHF